jgi:hypothetical protein
VEGRKDGRMDGRKEVTKEGRKEHYTRDAFDERGER